jgi:hypothetical protein
MKKQILEMQQPLPTHGVRANGGDVMKKQINDVLKGGEI